MKMKSVLRGMNIFSLKRQQLNAMESIYNSMTIPLRMDIISILDLVGYEIDIFFPLC